jgi:hypothetical protein
LACPFFMPTQKTEDIAWMHPSRLPLGAGWRGRCCAPGHEGAEPNDAEIHDCNLGYAAQCTRLPQDRNSDAVRFAVARDGAEEVSLFFVTEKAHRPAAHGALSYNPQSGEWASSQSDPCIQKMAECYLQSYFLRRIQPAPAENKVSKNP